jgi:putative oxidoreductase
MELCILSPGNNDVKTNIELFDTRFIVFMRQWGIVILRIALGIIFLWFGALKAAGASPVALLIQSVYPFVPANQFIVILGVWEVVIGLGLIFKWRLRVTLALLWMQMAGVMLSPFFAPAAFFSAGNPLLLTMEGEFLVKNIVLIAASIVVAGYQVRPWRL